MGLAGRRTAVGIAAGFALVIGACGGGDGGDELAEQDDVAAPLDSTVSESDDDEATDAEPPAGSATGASYESEVVAERAIESLGSDVDAATAVLMSMAKGNSVEQIVDAILTERLDRFGEIHDGPAGFARPSATPAPRADLCLNPDDDVDCKDEIDGRIADWEARGGGQKLTGIILRMAARGYDENQITAAISAGLLGTGPLVVNHDGRIRDCPDNNAPCDVYGPAERIVCIFTEIETDTCLTNEPDGPQDEPTENASEPDQQTPDSIGGIEDGTYTGMVDTSSDFGQFFADLEGVADVDKAEVVVSGGSIAAFMLELSGTGASNFNVATGERLCENPISITAELNEPGGVELSGDTAEVPVTFSFVQEVGSGAECFEESNVAFDETLDDVATIVFSGDSATATLTSGIGAIMTRTD